MLPRPRIALSAICLLVVTVSVTGCFRKKKKIDDQTLAMAVGAKHGCALMTDKGVRCWGMNDQGQLGPSSREPHPTPVRMVGNTDKFIDLEAGGSLTCARTESHTLDCWGGFKRRTASGEEPIPIDVSGLKDVEQISIGANHACVRLEAGTVRCFGDNERGQIGLGHTNRVAGVAEVPGVWGAISVCAGKEHSCAVVTDGSVRCWGRNHEGQLGDGTTKDSAAPVNVAQIASGRRVACGGAHTCVLTGDGGIRCFGKNDQGQVGDGTRVRKTTATVVAGLEEQLGVAAGDAHTCAWGKDATVRCWGANDQSQMADGTKEPRLLPHRIPGFTGQNITAVPERPFAITDVKAGDGFTCVRATDNRVRCWGRNDLGQAGDGTREVRAVPVGVKLAKPEG